MIRLILIPFLCLTALKGFSQCDFNHYCTLESRGEIPSDFTISPAKKSIVSIDTKQTELSLIEEREFIEYVNYSVDQLLYSGNVIYGDEISTYVQQVASNLLKNDPELSKNLRFYTIKSNTTNAVSTYQGIIFITTGLISQLTSEAQLAYILSHEIAHYTQKHIVTAAEWRSEQPRKLDPFDISNYSKEHEFEADELAIKRYVNAGYDPNEIITTFDVLMYSYLPFDEVPVPKNYLIQEGWAVPESQYLGADYYDITAEENYNDNYSSHPNIKKRKEAISKIINNYTLLTDNRINPSTPSLFHEVRNLARFECVRTYISDAKFYEALYAVFLLEHEFPESTYLLQMKALAWLGLAYSTENTELSENAPKKEKYEGRSPKMYYFISQFPKDGLIILATRYIYDAAKTHPEDEMIRNTRDDLINFLARSSNFSLNKCFSVTFSEALEELAKKKSNSNNPLEELSKYEKIRREKDMAVLTDNSLDSTKFFRFIIPDVVKDSTFLKLFNSAVEKFKISNEQLKSYRRDNLTNKKHWLPEVLPIELNDFLFLEPFSLVVNKTKINWKNADDITLLVTESFDRICMEENIKMSYLNKTTISTFGTDAFNAYNYYLSLTSQLYSWGNISCTPVDFMTYQQMNKDYYSTSFVYNRTGNFNSGNAISRTISDIIVIDPLTGSLKNYIPFEFTGFPTRSILMKFHTHILKNLRTSILQ